MTDSGEQTTRPDPDEWITGNGDKLVQRQDVLDLIEKKADEESICGRTEDKLRELREEVEQSK